MPTTHEARIAAKRLRYLLEPAVRYSDRGESLVHKLRRLQNDLGALHDVRPADLHLAISGATWARNRDRCTC